MSKLRVLFRVDANSALGLGHIMRCLVLADVLRSRGHTCAFLSLNSDIDLLGILKNKGFRAEDYNGKGVDQLQQIIDALKMALSTSPIF